MDVELSRWNLSRESDGLFELEVSGRDGALDFGIGFSSLLADIESFCQELDEAKLDNYISKSAVLINVKRKLQTLERLDQWLFGRTFGAGLQKEERELTLISSLTVPLARTVRF